MVHGPTAERVVMLLWFGFLCWWIGPLFRRDGHGPSAKVALGVFAVSSFVAALDFNFTLELLLRAIESLFTSWKGDPIAYVVPTFGIPIVLLLIKGVRQGLDHMGFQWRENARDALLAGAIVLVPFYSYHLFWKVPRDITNAAIPKVPCVKCAVFPPTGWESKKTRPVLNGSNILIFAADLEPGKFSPGTEVAGFRWKREYSAFWFSLRNAATFGIENINFTVSTEGYIARMEQTTGVPNVDIGTKHPAPPAVVTNKDANGNPVSKLQPLIPFESTKTVKVYCGHLTGGTVLSFIVASVDIDPRSMSFDPRAPAVVNIEGTFETGPVEGSKRFTAKWRHAFETISPTDNITEIRRALASFITTQPASAKTNTYAQIEWTKAVGTYLDRQVGHACSILLYSFLAGNTLEDVMARNSRQIKELNIFAKQPTRETLAAYCEGPGWH